MSNIGTAVYVASIDHRYGNTMSVHATIEGAKKFIYDWIVHEWNLSAGLPRDYDEAISEFFAVFTGESCSIYPTNVEA